MELYDALVSRRTIYFFKERAVPSAVIHRALNAARFAPNHRLTEPWRFLVLGPKTKSILAERNVMLNAGKAPSSPEARAAFMARARDKIEKVPAIIVMISKKTPENAFAEREDYAASVCATQNLMLALWDQGVGSQWSTGALTRHEDIYALLGVDSATEDIIGFLRAGYPEKTPTTQRKPLTDILEELP